MFPAANHLRLGADWSGLNNFLEGANKPLIVLGLGAQSPKIGGEKETISALKADAGIRRMVDIFRDRAVLVTVRGRYSQEVCVALGLEAVEVLGCPSAMINPAPDLGRRLADGLRDLADGGGEARIGVTAAAPFEIAGSAWPLLSRSGTRKRPHSF